MNNDILKFGKYYGKKISEIPFDYLTWLFPILLSPISKPFWGHYDFDGFLSILKYFLSKKIKVEFLNEQYNFYFIDPIISKPFGGELEFMTSKWKGINSKGENVYEIIYKEHTNLEVTYFILEQNGNYSISTEYVKQIYTIRETTLVYQKTSEYYFIDPYGKVYYGAYLMREPWVPEGVSESFSQNIKINEY